MMKKFSLASTRMASARNIRENRIRESSFNKIPKESSFQKLTIEKEKTPKPANDHLRLIIDGLNAYSKEEIFAEMLKILKKPQPERNHLDIKFLIFATTNIKFFQKTAMEMGRRAYEKICNFIEYGHYSSGETIFNLGRFYYNFIFYYNKI